MLLFTETGVRKSFKNDLTTVVIDIFTKSVEHASAIVPSPGSVLLKLKCAHESPEGLLNTQIQQIWGEAPDYAFLGDADPAGSWATLYTPRIQTSGSQTLRCVLLIHRLQNLIPRLPDSVKLKWGPFICISRKFPDDVNAFGQGTTLGTTDLDQSTQTMAPEKSGPPPVFVNKVFIYIWLSYCTESCNRAGMPTKLKIYPIWPFTEKVCQHLK